MLPASSVAQLARVHVTDATNRLPIAGAMVSLARLGDTSVVARLTDTAGLTLLRAGATGKYHLIARRIGYRPSDTTISVGATLIDISVALVNAGVVLKPIVVEDETSCITTRQAGERVFQLWDAVRNALEINTLTESQHLVRMEIEQYERDLTPDLRERAKKIQRKQTTTRQPFSAASPQYLESVGYITGRGGGTYFAPDARTLLSDEFARSHCFSLVPARKNEKNFVGLAFSPTPERSQPDVSGVLWLDASTLALSHLVFHYVNDPLHTRTNVSGGRVDFAQLRGGAWIIPRWYILTPRVARVRRAVGSLARIEESDTLLGFRESGANARELAAGEESGSVVSEEAQLNEQHTVAEAPSHLPDRENCMDSAASAKTTTLYGKVSNERGLADPTLHLFVSWSKPELHVIGRQVVGGERGQLIEVHPDSEGNYAICSLPLGQEFRFELRRGLAKLEAKLTTAPDTAARIETNFMTAAVTGTSLRAPAAATLSGTVLVEGTVNEVVSEAEVIVSNLRTRTDSQGHFRLEGIARDSRVIQIRRLGFIEYQGTADFSGIDSSSARFFLKRIAGTVDTVVVRSVQPQMGMEEFEYRKAHGFGSYLTRAQLAKQEGHPLSEILATLSGLQVIRLGGSAAAVATARSSAALTPRSSSLDASDRRRGAKPACYSQVFLDGVRIFAPGFGQPLFDVNTLTPQGIEGIEYYRSSAETPAQYSSTDAACGTLIVWTRRGNPEVPK